MMRSTTPSPLSSKQSMATLPDHSNSPNIVTIVRRVITIVVRLRSNDSNTRLRAFRFERGEAIEARTQCVSRPRERRHPVLNGQSLHQVFHARYDTLHAVKDDGASAATEFSDSPNHRRG